MLFPRMTTRRWLVVVVAIAIIAYFVRANLRFESLLRERPTGLPLSFDEEDRRRFPRNGRDVDPPPRRIPRRPTAQ